MFVYLCFYGTSEGIPGTLLKVHSEPLGWEDWNLKRFGGVQNDKVLPLL